MPEMKDLNFELSLPFRPALKIRVGIEGDTDGLKLDTLRAALEHVAQAIVTPNYHVWQADVARAKAEDEAAAKTEGEAVAVFAASAAADQALEAAGSVMTQDEVEDEDEEAAEEAADAAAASAKRTRKR